MKKLGIAILIILFVAVVASGVYFVFFQDSSFKSVESQNVNVDMPLENSEVQKKELDIHSYIVEDLYQKINPSNDAMILKGLYGGESLSNEYILVVGAMNYIRKTVPIDAEMVQNMMFTLNISKKDLEQNIYEIFGNIEYQDEDFYVLNGDYGVCGFTYQPEIEQYISLNGCGGSNTDSFVREVVSARQEGNFLYITEKSIYIYADWNETITRKTITRKYIYNNCQQDKMLDYQETPSTESRLVELDDYIEEAATYEYVFENQNGQYIFKEFHPV